MNDDLNYQGNALERSFGQFIQRLAGQGSCSELLTTVNRLSRARAEGHICIDLSGGLGTREAEEIINLLLATPVVGRPGEQVPLIVDGPYLYLQRYHRDETLVADFIKARQAPGPLPFAVSDLGQGLARLFPAGGQGGPDWQQIAAMAALTRNFTVISGGPGTGKTTTVAKILALYLELNRGRGKVIRLAAPTGKAAARLQESIRQVKGRLPLAPEVLAELPEETLTIHRLLGLAKGRPRYDRHHQLAVDLLVVDEASMVDLPLMAQLMAALPRHCALILLGDHYQLSSVQPGAVLGDICSQGQGFSDEFYQLAQQIGLDLGDGPRADNPLADGIITLRTSYRFDDSSGIRRLSEAVNDGHSDEALAILADDRFADVRLVDYGASCDDLVANILQPAFAGLLAGPGHEERLAALGRLGVLCAHRQGPSGKERINELLVKLLAGPTATALPLYAGLPVMIAANNYELELYNGDTGVIVEEHERLYACFSDNGGVRQILARRLPPHDPAYAMTIHKSQGSEFDRVVVVLPAQPSRVLGRELLYTALTRARQEVEVWGSPEIFRQAVAVPVQRVSGLGRRLWGAGDAAA